eukprot:3556751-Alexandrium_andersonii.AAC.1
MGIETPDFHRESATFQDCSAEPASSMLDSSSHVPTQLDAESGDEADNRLGPGGPDAMSAVDRLAAEA